MSHPLAVSLGTGFWSQCQQRYGLSPQKLDMPWALQSSHRVHTNHSGPFSHADDRTRAEKTPARRMQLHGEAGCHSLPETCEPDIATSGLGLENMAGTSALFGGQQKGTWTPAINGINNHTSMAASLPGPGLKQWRHSFVGSLVSQCLIRISRAIERNKLAGIPNSPIKRLLYKREKYLSGIIHHHWAYSSGITY